MTPRDFLALNFSRICWIKASRDADGGRLNASLYSCPISASGFCARYFVKLFFNFVSSVWAALHLAAFSFAAEARLFALALASLRRFRVR